MVGNASLERILSTTNVSPCARDVGGAAPIIVTTTIVAVAVVVIASVTDVAIDADDVRAGTAVVSDRAADLVPLELLILVLLKVGIMSVILSFQQVYCW